MELIQRAVVSGANIDVFEKLMGLHERAVANKAHKAYAAAMADAKAEFPAIKKERKVDYTNRQGQRTFYKFADMAAIAEAIDKPLSKHGLTYRFRTVTTAPAVVTVTCIISHRDGYSEENSLSATADLSGNKNAIQAIGSAVTYLQRYTLNAALGLTATDDDDGDAAGDAAPPRSPVRANRDPIEKPAPVEIDPYELEINERNSEDEWKRWANDLFAYIKAARTFERVDEWIVANSDGFEALKHYDVGKFNKLRHMIQAVQDGKAKAARDDAG